MGEGGLTPRLDVESAGLRSLNSKGRDASSRSFPEDHNEVLQLVATFAARGVLRGRLSRGVANSCFHLELRSVGLVCDGDGSRSGIACLGSGCSSSAFSMNTSRLRKKRANGPSQSSSVSDDGGCFDLIAYDRRKEPLASKPSCLMGI